MDLKQLKTFRVVHELLSFTEAAKRLYLAQSSVSAQIKALEDDLKVRLFDRIGKQVVSTEAGDKLYQYARRMESMADEIRDNLSEDSTGEGSLTIRVPETIASVYLPEIVERCDLLFPKASFVFTHCTDIQLAQELNSGRIDLAFLMTDDLSMKNVNIKYVKEEPLVFACAPDHELATSNNLKITDLNNQTLLFPRTD